MPLEILLVLMIGDEKLCTLIDRRGGRQPRNRADAGVTLIIDSRIAGTGDAREKTVPDIMTKRHLLRTGHRDRGSSAGVAVARHAPAKPGRHRGQANACAARW